MTSITLRNGVIMPAVGTGCAYGDWVGATDYAGFLPEKAWRGTYLALQAGARHFDMAYCYATHRQVSDVLGQAFMRGELERKDVFLTTKIAHPPTPPHVNISPSLTMAFSGKSDEDLIATAAHHFDQSLLELGVGYVDLLLMHWPGAFDATDGVRARAARKALWTVFERALEKKQARAIGVCNFSIRHLKELIEDGVKVEPMVNQIEVHPYCFDKDLIDFCTAHGIVVEAYAPFASGAFGLLKDEVISTIAAKHKRGTGQVILRWLFQKGIAVLPKSSSEARMKENQSIFDFELTPEDVVAMDRLHPAGTPAKRSCPDPAAIL